MNRGVVKNKRDIAQRVHWMHALFLFFAAAILVRFGMLQFPGIQGKTVRGTAALFEEETIRERGEIFLQDRFGARTPLAMNKDFYTITADPRHVADKEGVAHSLSEILDVPYAAVMNKLSKENDPYEVIATKVDGVVAERIIALNFDGIHFEATRGRYYPYQRMASHLSGFLGVKGDAQAGQYGLEGVYDDILGGAGGD